MEFFGGEALIFTKFFRGRPIIFRGISPHFMEVFGDECNFSQSSRVRLEEKVSPQPGVWILNAITQ